VVDDGDSEGVTDWEGVFEGVWLGVGVGVRAMEGVWEREAPKLGWALGVGVKEGVRQKPVQGLAGPRRRRRAERRSAWGGQSPAARMVGTNRVQGR